MSSSSSTNEHWRQDVKIDDIPPEGQKLLRDYAGLKQDEILPHIENIRKKGYAIAPYACISAIRFLGDRWSKIPYGPRFLARLKSDANITFLDVGCGFGQELRFLITEHGVHPSQLFGFDLEPGLIDVGYELFRDGDGGKAGTGDNSSAGADAGTGAMTMFGANIFDDDSDADNNNNKANTNLDTIRGKMDMIQASHVLHMFDYDQQFDAARRLIGLAKPTPGSMIAGSQVGSRNPGSYVFDIDLAPTRSHYRHDERTMREFWTKLGHETGSAWDVQCGEIHNKTVEESRGTKFAQGDQGMMIIWFCATRV
ncbi:hypothetical protein PV05_07556 [Exophiala xenobiotica]|uniref:Methyltransferase domain-containing protein n=1 Tax=Exophiala xenobiotica TaxID=348802 RepID=A0A0D2F5U7_9EURO|nr:uncharacterized protein PV05_07556 [Exophiala xenobiotica]KIW55264.1 hypothetical protein PV05_07556 [Exophiala xenobiotica]